jgi:hypothetical protein
MRRKRRARMSDPPDVDWSEVFIGVSPGDSAEEHKALTHTIKQQIASMMKPKMTLPFAGLGGAMAAQAQTQPSVPTPSLSSTLQQRLEETLRYHQAAVADLENALHILNADPKAQEFMEIVNRRL